MRKLSNIFGGAEQGEQKRKSAAYVEEPLPLEETYESDEVMAKGLQDVSQVKYEEDILTSEKFFDYGITYVKTLKLRSLADVQKVSHELNEGNIVVADISVLNDRDPLELKRTIDQIKGICRGIGGDVAGIGDTMHVIITPSNIKIWRDKV